MVSERFCGICGFRLTPTGRIEGYIEGRYFDLHRCKQCETTSASPPEADQELYDIIYKNADALPGYWRYSGYASEVIKENQPLTYLASREDMYWAVERFLSTVSGQKKRLKVLEIGSGLGYLTYSVAQAGFNIRGLELSSAAVAQSRQRYGDLFACGSVEEYAASHTESFDRIIVTEVIEHVADPVALLKTAMRLMHHNGKMLVTTPNRSYFLGDRCWGSDLPPVHVWWFSEKSMRALAARLDTKVHIPSFWSFNCKYPGYPFDRWFKKSYRIEPVLDQERRPRTYRGGSRGNRKSWLASNVPWRLQRLYMVGLNVLLNPSGKRETLAAVFSKI
jgi:SAM-dependent methyltransferase